MTFVKTIVLALVLLVGAPVGAATIVDWDVDYWKNGTVGEASRFFGDGVYLFLLAPDSVSIYLHDGFWRAQGHLGDVELPEGMPAIVFPPGTDIAAAVPVFASPAALATSVPEPDVLPMMVAGLVYLAAWAAVLRRRSA